MRIPETFAKVVLPKWRQCSNSLARRKSSWFVASSLYNFTISPTVTPCSSRVSGDSSLLKDGKVEASPTAAQESLHDFRAAKPNAELEARHSWLADNKLCRPNAEAINNVNNILKKALRCEVLAERSPAQV